MNNDILNFFQQDIAKICKIVIHVLACGFLLHRLLIFFTACVLSGVLRYGTS